MLMSNLDPDVAERPDDLVVYGGSGKAARNWPAYDAIVVALRPDDDETLLIQEDRGLTMYGQMTAERRIYIETQEIVQGGMGGAQPLAATMNGGAALVVDVDRDHIARSSALEANAAEALPKVLQRDAIPDVVTDQTSAHGALNRYTPHGMSLAKAVVLRERHPQQRHPQQCIERSMASMARHVAALLAFRARGAVTCDDGNNRRAQAQHAGVDQGFDSCLKTRLTFRASCPKMCVLSSARATVRSARPRAREIPTTFA